MNTRISILPKEELAMIRQTILEKISEDQISFHIGLNILLIALHCMQTHPKANMFLFIPKM